MLHGYIRCFDQVTESTYNDAGITHWGRETHICDGNLTIIGSDNGLSPGRRQAITWTNVEILLIGPLGSNISEMLIEIHTFSFKKIHLKMSSGKWRPFRLGLNVINASYLIIEINNVIVLLWDHHFMMTIRKTNAVAGMFSTKSKTKYIIQTLTLAG